MGGRLILGYQKSLPAHDILILLGYFGGGYTSGLCCFSLLECFHGFDSCHHPHWFFGLG